MDVNALTTLISNVGFPIAACAYMAYANMKQAKMHQEEMAKVTEAVNELKVAVTALTEKIK